MSAELATRPTPEPATVAPEVSLSDMLQVMDVARILRKEQEIATAQFHRDEARALLRKKLLASTDLTGEQLTAAEVDAAIDQYFNSLHTYRDPPWSASLLFAHLYIRRWLVLALFVVGILTGFCLS